MICNHCKVNTVKTYGSKVCSLKCATEAMGENYNVVAKRLKQAIIDSKKVNIKGSRKKNDKRD